MNKQAFDLWMSGGHLPFEAQSVLPHLGRAFTDAQELRQAA